MPRRMLIDDALALTIPRQPVLSPDGTRLVYVLGGTDVENDRTTSALWIVDADGARPLTHGTDDTDPVFSPSGDDVAFRRDGQLWTMRIDGGEPRRRTDLALGAGPAVWSPDGTRFAFTAPVDPGPGGSRDAPIVSDGIGYCVDGAGFSRGVRSQVHVLDLADDTVRCLTDGDVDTTAPTWSPDGGTLACIIDGRSSDGLVRRAGVHLLDPDDPASPPRPIAFADGIAQTITYAPDGEHLIVVGWEGDPVGHARLFRIALPDGSKVELAGALDRNVMPGAPAYPGAVPQVTSSGDVIFAVRDRGATHLYAVPLYGGACRHVHGAEDEVISGLSIAGDALAFGLSSKTSFGEIVRADVTTGAAEVVTAHGDTLAGVELFTRESRKFTISDGWTVEGWIVRDPERTGASPLLVDIHGGPHNAWNAAVDEMHVFHQELAARGWTILLINPRGSDGYGEQFWTAVNGGWGVADAADFLEPIDQLVAEGMADPTRLAVTGYSYGGFMTAFLTGHDQRFAAAVAGGLVADLTSMGGTSDDAHLLSRFEVGALPWDRADQARLKAMSPYSAVDRVHTPTLVLHGADDLRCPVGQAQQWHYALSERGVPTRLVLYPGGSHIFPLTGRPSHRVDYARRVVQWVDQYAGGAEPRPERLDAAHWQSRLTRLRERHGVPGAQLGILRYFPDATADETVIVTDGVLNVDTGAPVTADAVFQIGSITKVWTATAIMRLIEAGHFGLDTPVADIIPDLVLANPALSAGVTVRHLLAHTSGLDGDVIVDTGRGDDCVAKYVDLLADVDQIHPLGATWSYCNAGFVVLGRIIEVVTGMVWDAAMRELIFEPLGLTRAVTLPEEAILHPVAVGHVDAGDGPIVAPAWNLQRSMGPAGLVTAAAADVLAFARLHMTGGRDAAGRSVLSERTVAEMQSFQAEVPDKNILGDSWGLGWIRFDWNGARLYGHDGNTVGQAAFLRVHPESGVAVVLLTNGGNARDLYEDLYREIFAETSGIDMQHPVAPPAALPTIDIGPHLGTYDRASVRTEITRADDGSPLMRTTLRGALADLVPDPVEEFALTPLSENVFALRQAGTQTWLTVTFYTLPDGQRYLHFGARATPRVAT